MQVIATLGIEMLKDTELDDIDARFLSSLLAVKS
jgi:hypothetical protein